MTDIEQIREFVKGWQDFHIRGMKKGAAAYHQGAVAVCTEILTGIDNLLAESEDERMINELQRFLDAFGADYFGTGEWQQFDAWLEKQKDPHYTKRNALFDKCVENCDPEVMKEVSDKVEEMIMEKQKSIYDEWAKDREGCFWDGVAEGRRQIEQKPAEWSEEDEKMRNALWNLLHLHYAQDNAQTLVGIEAGKFRSWLKSLRHSWKPTFDIPSGNTFKDIIHAILTMLKDIDFTKITPEHRVSLLNDIRVKCKIADECAEILDEPSWKPSEEQMKALQNAVALTACDKELARLYDDLKKLM